MADRPILFSGSMVHAILEGRKTQTRRVVKPQPPTAAVQVSTWHHPDPRPHFFASANGEFLDGWCLPCPYGKPGDRLWVREAWRIGAWDENRPAFALDYCDGPRKEWITVPDPMGDDGELFNRLWQQSTDDAIKALGQQDRYEWEPGKSPCRWRPSIHMPRWASRLLLEVTDVRVERLNDISESDALAEGITEGTGDFAGCFTCGPAMSGTTANECYERLWESINGPGSWAANPWVWVVGFRKVKP